MVGLVLKKLKGRHHIHNRVKGPGVACLRTSRNICDIRGLVDVAPNAPPPCSQELCVHHEYSTANRTFTSKSGGVV